MEQIQQDLSYFSTYSPPEFRQLSYRGANFCIPVWNHCDTYLRLSVYLKTQTLTGQGFLEV